MRTLFVAMVVAVTSVSCSKASAPAAAPSFTPQPYANLAQVMRGIPFTFSNIVFDAQAKDPGAPRAAAEVTAGAACLFDPRDHVQLARILLQLLDDDAARRALSAAGLRRAAHFSWSHTARATLDVYAEAVKRRRQ